MVSPEAVQRIISQHVGLKEKLQKKADQSSDSTFTSSVIDATMGKKLGVTNTGTTNDKVEGTTFKAPDIIAPFGGR